MTRSSLSRPALLVLLSLLALLALLAVGAPAQAQPLVGQSKEAGKQRASAKYDKLPAPFIGPVARTGTAPTAGKGGKPGKTAARPGPAPPGAAGPQTAPKKASPSSATPKKATPKKGLSAGPPGPVLRSLSSDPGLPVIGPPSTRRSTFLGVRAQFASPAFRASAPFPPVRPTRADASPLRPLQPPRSILRNEVVPVVRTLVRESTKNPAFPLSVALVVVLFLLVQHRIDARDPKLAGAPLEGPTDIGFAPPVRLA